MHVLSWQRCQIIQLVCNPHVAYAFCCCGCTAPHSLVIPSLSTVEAVARQ